MLTKAAYCAVAAFALLSAAAAIGKEGTRMNGLTLSSPVFQDNGYIPSKYTCDGENSNPPLVIENVPPEAKSMVLIVDDPDAPAGTWVHWVMWNIDPHTREIRENSVPKGAGQGVNDFKQHGYGGPCPPSGAHRYFFKLYALDTPLQANPNATKSDIEKMMQGHIIARTQIIGLYRRK